MQIDPNAPIIEGGSFTWREYAWLPQFGRMAEPTEQQYLNARFLFTKLQPFREELGLPLIVTGGARTLEYAAYLRSKGIPAAKASAHNDWAAVDLICPRLNVPKLWAWLDARWEGRMELLLYTPSWVHLDTRAWKKRERFRP